MGSGERGERDILAASAGERIHCSLLSDYISVTGSREKKRHGDGLRCLGENGLRVLLKVM